MQYSYDGSETKYLLARQIKQLLGRSKKEEEDSHDPLDVNKEEFGQNCCEKVDIEAGVISLLPEAKIENL